MSVLHRFRDYIMCLCDSYVALNTAICLTANDVEARLVE